MAIIIHVKCYIQFNVHFHRRNIEGRNELIALKAIRWKVVGVEVVGVDVSVGWWCGDAGVGFRS